MTRRAFAALVACLPLSWQVKLGVAQNKATLIDADWVIGELKQHGLPWDGRDGMLPVKL